MTDPTKELYSEDDFASVRKFDAHVHANTSGHALSEQAREDGFELMVINVDSPGFPHIADQRAAAIAMVEADPERVHWTTTFSMSGFGLPGWVDRVTAGLAEAKAAGARGVKIWKNIGMIERDADGRLITLDHPGLSPLAAHAHALGLALIGHQGEPHNCWLPLEQMTTDNDRRYFRRRPQHHMYLHPGRPSYEDLITTRDQFLATHPDLLFVAAHLGSLEHDVDRVAAFLDRFPNAVVDVAARMSHLQHQSIADRERMRAFFIRHQDRILYGTDLTITAEADPIRFRRAAHAIWTSDWRYLATAQSQHAKALDAEVVGLALPRDVIDKVYYRNAARVFGTDARIRQT